jgi:hypothetical protein
MHKQKLNPKEPAQQKPRSPHNCQVLYNIYIRTIDSLYPTVMTSSSSTATAKCSNESLRLSTITTVYHFVYQFCLSLRLSFEACLSFCLSRYSTVSQSFGLSFVSIIYLSLVPITCAYHLCLSFVPIICLSFCLSFLVMIANLIKILCSFFIEFMFDNVHSRIQSTAQSTNEVEKSIN